MLDWNDLKTFAEVARKGTMAEAARALQLHPTTVARRIEAAESSLGVALFLRTGRKLVLSSAGRAILGGLEPLVDIIDDVARNAQRLSQPRLRVAMTENGGRIFALACASAFWEAGLEVEVLTDDKTVDLSRAEADLAVRVVVPEDEELVARRISTVRYGLYGAQRYLEGAPSFRPGWPGHRVLVASGGLARGPEALYLHEHASQAQVALRASSHAALAVGAEQGLGLVVLPKNLALFHAGLSLVRSLDEIEGRPVWLVFHESQRGNPGIQQAAKLIEEGFKRLDARASGGAGRV